MLLKWSGRPRVRAFSSYGVGMTEPLGYSHCSPVADSGVQQTLSSGDTQPHGSKCVKFRKFVHNWRQR